MINVFIILTVGFITIQIISIMLARKVKKHLDKRAASYLHLFVAVIAAYYFYDVLLHAPIIFTDPFIYFWLSIVFTQLAFFIFERRKNRSVPNCR